MARQLAARPPDTAGREGEPDLEAFFAEHHRAVARLTRRLLGRDDDVEDVVQDVFESAMRHLGSLRDAGSARPWLLQATINRVRSLLRWRRVRRTFGLSSAAASEDVAVSARPDDRALVAMLYRTLDRLPANVRVAWVLRRQMGEGLDEVARLCGRSERTIKRWVAETDVIVAEVLGDD